MQRKKLFWILILILAMNIGLYSLNLNDFFVSDDFDWVHITHTSEKPLYLYFASNYSGLHEGGSYRPFINTLFKIDHSIWGLNPVGYHITNLLFHALTAFVIYLLVLKLFAKNKLAVLSGILFSIMPNHAEVAIWISGRCDVSSVLFYLLSFYLYIIFREKKRYRYFGLSILCFVISLLSKEMAITLPAIILAYELYLIWQKQNYKLIYYIKSIGWSFIYVALVVLFFVVRYRAIGLLFGYYGKSQIELNLHKVYIMFLNLISDSIFFLHTRLRFVHFFQDKPLLFFTLLLLTILIIIKLIKKYRPKIILWLAFYFITMLPVLNLSFHALNDEGERYHYLPSVAVAIILSIILVSIRERFGKYIFYVTSMILIIYLGYFTIQKSLIWNQASKLSNNVVNGVAQSMNKEAKEGVVIFLMPDNYQGAQVMRNGLSQAIEMFYEPYKLDSIILPIYVNLTPANYNQNLVDIQNIQNGFFGTSNVHLITGPPRRESVDLTAELWNYNYSDFTANTVKLIFTEQFISQFDNKKIRFLVYNNGQIEELIWQ